MRKGSEPDPKRPSPELAALLTPPQNPEPTPRPGCPQAHQSQLSPASHLWSPARQARPPPEREARSCSLMASVGDRSHHGGGPISPRPTGSGSHGLRGCSVAVPKQRSGGAGRGRRHTGGPASPRGSRQRQEQVVLMLAQRASSPFPGPAQPTTLTQTPVTTGSSHWLKPALLGRGQGPWLCFLNLRHDGPACSWCTRWARRLARAWDRGTARASRPEFNPLPCQPAPWLQAAQVTRPAPFPSCSLL